MDVSGLMMHSRSSDLAVPRRRRHECRALVEQAVAPRLVVVRVPARTTEQQDAELGLHDQFEMAGIVDQPGTLASDVERSLDRVAVGLGAVGRQAEPERQAAGATRQVMGEVAGVPVVTVAVGVAPVQHVEVLGVLRVRGAADVGIAIHQRAAVERSEEPLVRVDDEAVGVFDAAVQIAHAGSGQPCAAVGTVDVQPHFCLGTHFG